MFLRELYRNSILMADDDFVKEDSTIPRVDSFESLLRKGRTVCYCWCSGSSVDLFAEDDMAMIPCRCGMRNWFVVERHIAFFVDYYPNLDPGTLFHVGLSNYSFICDYMESHWITLNHIESHWITSNHIESHRITSNHIESHRITSNHIESVLFPHPIKTRFQSSKR